jgi:flavin reductase (DIM6/NTAB) family NADH-FMN oxidoreductase RutF
MDAKSGLPTSQDFRNAMARVPTAVHIVATDGPAGRRGMTASAVCSVSDTPPTLLVCVSRASRSNGILKANGILSVNALRADQSILAEQFAGRLGGSQEDWFNSGEWSSLVTGAPTLSSGICTFDCRITRADEVGTHSVIFAEVVAVAQGAPADGLIYKDRTYQVAPQQPD